MEAQAQRLALEPQGTFVILIVARRVVEATQAGADTGRVLFGATDIALV